MGIPLFFRYLINNYDNLLSSNKQLLDCDNLYLDLNCAIHYCCREVLKNEKFSLTNQNNIENKMIQFVIQYIEILVEYSKPKNYYILRLMDLLQKPNLINKE